MKHWTHGVILIGAYVTGIVYVILSVADLAAASSFWLRRRMKRLG